MGYKDCYDSNSTNCSCCKAPNADFDYQWDFIQIVF